MNYEQERPIHQESETYIVTDSKSIHDAPETKSLEEMTAYESNPQLEKLGIQGDVVGRVDVNAGFESRLLIRRSTEEGPKLALVSVEYKGNGGAKVISEDIGHGEEVTFGGGSDEYDRALSIVGVSVTEQGTIKTRLVEASPLEIVDQSRLSVAVEKQSIKIPTQEASSPRRPLAKMHALPIPGKGGQSSTYTKRV